VALAGLAHPAWGANFGGALTAAVGIGAMVGLDGGRRRLALALGAGLVAAVVVVAGVDALRAPAAQTHLGRLVHEVGAGGVAPLQRMALGKLATNLRLARSFWGLLLACEVAE